LLNTQETFFSFTICLLGKKTMLESLATTTKNTDGIKIEKSLFFNKAKQMVLFFICFTPIFAGLMESEFFSVETKK
jgi:hypothetical protein